MTEIPEPVDRSHIGVIVYIASRFVSKRVGLLGLSLPFSFMTHCTFHFQEAPAHRKMCCRSGKC